jgi:hypothetical protein
MAAGCPVSGFNDERAAIAGKLEAAGVAVSLDPRAVPPTVRVDAPSVVGIEGVGGWRCDYPVHILSTPPGNVEALDWMLEALEVVLSTFPGALGYPTTVDMSGVDVPAYTVTLTRSVTNPNC